VGAAAPGFSLGAGVIERLDQFMARANAAYYADRNPFRDFTTAPEIAQAFGEVLGAWSAVIWESMGHPAPVLFAELGPGRGTLMADALRGVAKAAPGFRDALRVHLVEASPRLRAEQAGRVPDAVWHDGIATLPPGPMILLANEFLDALPIRQFVRRDTGWAERFVEHGRFVERPAAAHASGDAPEGAVIELGEAARDLVATLAARLAREGGAALFLDYGPERSAPGDSLQAIRAGRFADPLAAPAGEADLTAHVDFAALAQVARTAGATVWGPVPQGPFLARLGLFQRTDRLARGKPQARAAALIGAAQRLAEPDRMGRLFKALCIADPTLPTPPGFEP
jgi:NADH dehydrogenase [ubiquinone] 1 alpha subcomplex assembly factor 7